MKLVLRVTWTSVLSNLEVTVSVTTAADQTFFTAACQRARISGSPAVDQGNIRGAARPGVHTKDVDAEDADGVAGRVDESGRSAVELQATNPKSITPARVPRSPFTCGTLPPSGQAGQDQLARGGGVGLAAHLAEQFEPIYKFLLNKWYFDELYHFLFVKPAFAIGRFLWKSGDEGTIDRFGPNGSAWLVQRGAAIAGRVQSGYLYTYAFVMLLGLTAAITWAITR